MTRSANVIEGVIVPLLTPVDEKERVDEPALRALISHCVRGGVDGIFVGGTAGLGPLLTDDQWKRLMEIARDEVPDSVLLLAGVIAPSTSRAIERIRFLDQLGFENMVVTPTFYVIVTESEEFLSHFDGCRQATDMNMVVYNIPSCTSSSIPIGAIAEMVAGGWTQTIKESSGDREYFTAVVQALDDAGAGVLQGNEPDIAWGLSSGARGLVPVCGNYAPRLFAAAWQASQAGNEDQLHEIQAEISSVREVLLMGGQHWLAGALYGVHTLGIGDGHVTRPIQKLTEEQQREINALTEKLSTHESG
jgi:4-hydroxy-tetrahydrodipicolinate synthase